MRWWISLFIQQSPLIILDVKGGEEGVEDVEEARMDGDDQGFKVEDDSLSE